MLNGISSNLVNHTNNTPFEKVKQADIKNLAKELKTVSNSYKNLLSAVSITRRFEVNPFNKVKLANVYKQLTNVSNQAKDKKATMDAPNYLFNHKQSKLNQLEKLRTQANKLKLEISKRLNDYNNQTVQSNKQWEEQNDPKKILARQQQQAQRSQDKKNDVFNGGMVK